MLKEAHGYNTRESINFMRSLLIKPVEMVA